MGTCPIGRLLLLILMVEQCLLVKELSFVELHELLVLVHLFPQFNVLILDVLSHSRHPLAAHCIRGDIGTLVLVGRAVVGTSVRGGDRRGTRVIYRRVREPADTVRALPRPGGIRGNAKLDARWHE